MSEVWKEVDFHKGYYVSNYGKVINRQGKFLKHTLNKGYPQISICGKSYRIHTLVAKAFVPNIQNKETVNHIDGNKQNNYFLNLEWLTSRENHIHATQIGLIAKHERHNKAKLNKAKVISIRQQLLLGSTCQNIANQFGVTKSTISRIGLNKLWIF
jgi:hypothetical protein